MNADAYIPEFSAPARPAGNGAARSDRTTRDDSGFDALLAENAPAASGSHRAHSVRDAITDPRDRAIVPGRHGANTPIPPNPGQPPNDGGGQPPEQAPPPAETGGGAPFGTGAVSAPVTGGGTPFDVATLPAPETGGGTPFETGTIDAPVIDAPVTGGGTPFETGTIDAPVTGGGTPFEIASLTPPATGGGTPFDTGALPTPATGGGTPFTTAIPQPPSTGGGHTPELSGFTAPVTSGGLTPEAGAVTTPVGQSPAINAAETKPAAAAKSVQAPAVVPVTGSQGAPLQATGATGPVNTTAAAQPTAPAAQIIMGAQSLPTGELAAATDAGRPRAILEKSAGIVPSAGTSKTATATATPASTTATGTTPPVQNANGAAAVTTEVPTGASRDPVQALAQRNDGALPPETPSPVDGDFDADMTLQRQSADIRSADAATRPNTATQTQRLPAHTAPHLAAQVVRHFNQGQRQFEIRMDPPELGKIDVKLHVNSSDNRVHAVLSAERPETLADLQRSSRDLERALADAGLDLADSGLQFELSQGGEDARDGFDDRDPGFGVYAEGGTGESIPEQTNAAPTRLYGFALSGASGIDVRI